MGQAGGGRIPGEGASSSCAQRCPSCAQRCRQPREPRAEVWERSRTWPPAALPTHAPSRATIPYSAAPSSARGRKTPSAAPAVPKSSRWELWVWGGEICHPRKTPAPPNLGIAGGIWCFIVALLSRPLFCLQKCSVGLLCTQLKSNYPPNSLPEFAPSSLSCTATSTTGRKCEINVICPEPKTSNMAQCCSSAPEFPHSLPCGFRASERIKKNQKPNRKKKTKPSHSSTSQLLQPQGGHRAAGGLQFV